MSEHGREKGANERERFLRNIQRQLVSKAAFFRFPFFSFFSLSQRSIWAAPRTLSRPSKIQKMAQPGADYDPYDGIVSNPNKKKNPLVLVGAFDDGRKGVTIEGRVATRTTSGDLDLDLFFFLLLFTLSTMKHQNKTQAR